MVIYIAIAVAIAVAAIIFYRKKKKEKKMAQGLQVFNASGKLILDYTEQTYQLYGVGTVVGGVAGSVSDSRIIAGKTFIIPYSIKLTGGSSSRYEQQHFGTEPQFTITNGKISWVFNQYHSVGAYIGMGFFYGGVPK